MQRVTELGWRQRELAERSHVSSAIVREIQRHTVERHRSPRTLESLSVTLGWEPQHLDEVLRGNRPSSVSEPAGGITESHSSRLGSIERRLDEIAELLIGVKADLAILIKRAGSDG